jgi:hypothetical protein
MEPHKNRQFNSPLLLALCYMGFYEVFNSSADII